MSGHQPRRWARIVLPGPRREVDEELAFHLEAREREYIAAGMDPEQARAAARRRLGDLEGVRAECARLLAADRRDEARREWLAVSALDFRLGFRMLLKYPGLTIVGGLAMAFAIWVGAGTFEFVRQVVSPSLPIAEGRQVVGVLMFDAQSAGFERRTASDFMRWRGRLQSLSELGAFRTTDRNLVTGDGRGEPVAVAEITASAFAIARVPPILGRTLVPADEAAGAPRVAVLGHDVWQQRFGGDSAIVGRPVRIGGSLATVVGVMPEGFSFPISQSLWTPLSRAVLEQAPRQGPALFVLGRLARGASLADAQAELTALGARAARAFPATHEHLRPRVLPYARSILYLPTVAYLGVGTINIFVLLLIVLICSNVALLMFARAATRESELLVRSALGASRRRIVTQLFVEALVLGGLAALVGLSAAGFGLRWLYGTVLAELGGERLPFWFSEHVSAPTAAYTVLLTLLAAALAGVLPALKVTGRRVESRLRAASAGGGGLRFGGVWTAVIICQVAFTVALPAFSLIVRQDAESIRREKVNIAAEQYLAVRLELDRDESASTFPGWMQELIAPPRDGDTTAAAAGRFAARYRAAARELEQRLEARPGVRGVTFAERLPRMYHPHRLIEIDAGGAAPKRSEWPGYRVSSVAVSPDYFDVLGVPIGAGRGFRAGDTASGARAVIVNESFVRLVLGGRNPIGRRFQYMSFEGDEDADPGAWRGNPWYEIVGTVEDLGQSYGQFDPKRAGIYHPAAPGGAYPMHAAIHVAGNPEAQVHELRTLAAAVDPALRLYEPIALDRVDDSELRFYAFWLWILALVSGVAITLSLAGIYAVMSFAVSRRTREIGIRVALGASHGRIVAAIFRRPLLQIAGGLAAGAVLVTALALLARGGRLTPGNVLDIAGYMALMTGVCTLACIVPTRRALGIEPTDALRAE